MESVLIVASSDKGKELLSELLKTAGSTQLTMVNSGSEARRTMGQKDFELVVIAAPLSDEFGHELAVNTVETTLAGVILIVKRELADVVSSKVEDYGVLVIEKPISRILFYQGLKLIKAAQRRIFGLKKENIKLQNKITEMRIVERAKWALMTYLNMDENGAHRYIEKQAMDMQLTRKTVAENILKTYES